MILGKAPGPRRRATIRTEHVPQQPPVLPPAVERDQQNWAESQPYPLAPPSPAGARVTSVLPHAVSPVDYNSQPVHAEQIVMMDGEHECAHRSILGLEQKFFHVSYLILILMLSGCCQPTWAHQLLHIGPFNPETPLPICYSPFSAADIDAAFNSIFTNSTFQR